MKSTIDSGGRVVIPKALRARLGLTGGQALEIRERDGRIEIDPADTSVVVARLRRGTRRIQQLSPHSIRMCAYLHYGTRESTVGRCMTRSSARLRSMLARRC